MVLAADDGSLVKATSTLTVKQWIAQLLTSAGAALVGWAQPGTGLPVQTVETALRLGAVFVHTFRKSGETTDTAAVLRALATGYPVRYVAGKGSDTDGAYLQSQVEVPAGATIFGDGMLNTILRDVNGPEGTNGTTDIYGMFSATSGSNTTTIDNIHISDLQMQGMVASRAFREHRHLINLRGVRNVTIERVKFFGWRGDAVCLSGEVVTPVGATSYRHNFNVKILNNVFDGDTSDNRNAVSIVDCVGFDFLFNTVKNCTRSGMPGAVDFEPNAYPLYILTDANVSFNRFENVSGSVGVVCVQVPAAVTAAPLRVTIAHNKFVNCRNEIADVSLNMARTFTNADQSQKIVVTGNSGYGGVRPFVIYSAKGVRLDESNQWEHYDFGGRIGNTGATPKPYGCVIKPTLKDVGFAGIQVYRGDFLTLGGDYTDTATVSIFFDGTAAAGDGTSNVTLKDLRAGTLRRLNYDAETVNFAAGGTLTGGTSGATARIEEVIDNGTTGTLLLSKIVGTFQDNETITGSAGGSALANGAVGALVAVATSSNHALTAATNRFLYDTCELNGLAATFAAQDLRGSVTLVAGAATVTMPGVAASSLIFLQRSTNAGTAGDSFAVTRSAGTSFTITSKTANATVAGDTSTVSYRVEPA